MKYIFEEKVETSIVFEEASKKAESPEDERYLHAVLKDIFHHKLVDMVLDELTEAQKADFLSKIDDELLHDTILVDLKNWIMNFEIKLTQRIIEVEKELLGIIRNG
jgi:hypothetical protein